MLECGLNYCSHTLVDEHNVASAVGSGNMDVFATPSMIALMENAAMNAVSSKLPDGSATVGTMINVVHTKATPIGENVEAKAILTAIDGRKLTFSVVASDADGVIGEGLHERFIVEIEKFLKKIKK